MLAPAPYEDEIHLCIAEGLQLAIAPPGTMSPCGVMWFSIEHRNARNAREGAARKRRGVIAGIPDIIIQFDGRVFWIEVKRGAGVRSAEQRRLHAAFDLARLPVAVCRSLPEVLAMLATWGIPLTRKMTA